ncbi:hypothetical protein OJF2_21790 [Aquisphaera giovannonii]|uniref:DUF1573 domain-containing protein n=1 Tax=Aquisphaera giovannonii TaxID=406548 RepID=A0A5B9VZC1_9BACT|nr:DUF1573 domain-containing protein [Aquisphaera giovannonii]QEH33673.1 hypothetical protein OJF2_21790 [Aquisphaera giovannonii]
MRRMLLCGLAVVAISGQVVRGQGLEWVNAALPERAYDFGTVARGSQIRHAFPLVNRTDQEIRIVDWRTKCGCTDVKVGAKVVPPGTQTTIEATIDTSKFLGYKPSGLTVIFDKPSFVEVELNLTCFIRGDIVTSPGQLDFGTVRRSEKMPSTSLTITYAGSVAGWEVTKMKTQTAKVKAELRDLGRSAEGYSMYSLAATLQPNVENGFFKDEVTLLTNDPNMPAIPISVVANVQSAVAVTPSIINFGGVKAGQSITKTVLVRSSQPFSITRMTAEDGGLQSSESAEGAKPAHQVTLTFKAPEQAGPYHSVLTIETDMKDEPAAKLKTFATVVP